MAGASESVGRLYRKSAEVVGQQWRRIVGMQIRFPSSNKHLSEDEFTRCCAIIDHYQEEWRRIKPYCSARGRDALLYDRGNVWQGSFLDTIMKMVLSKKYNNLNRLRLIGWHFAGYRVFDLGGALDPPAGPWFLAFYNQGVDEIPEDIDSVITDAINPVQRINILLPKLNELMNSVDSRYLHSQPMRFGELAGEHQGYLVNGDSVRYWASSAVMYRSRIFDHLHKKIEERGYCKVMEIGPGYGGLAYQLKASFGDKLQFIAVDLVESLVFSSIYLTTLFPSEDYLLFSEERVVGPDKKLVFVPTFRSPEFFDAMRDVDLCINTVSMNEMSDTQVDYYGKNIAKVMADDGVFFECNWNAAVAGPNRIDTKSFLALHFNQRMSVGGTEVASDGHLDLWAKALPASVIAACLDEYPADTRLFSR